MRHELRSPVGGNMGWNAMLGEYVLDEEGSQSGGGNGIIGGYEDTLLGETVHHNQDGGEAT